MTECGQTMTHLPHWMHSCSSHTGISRAMLRFSHCVVAVGKVPSIGIALTGIWSPSPVIISASTLRTNSGALAETAGRISNFDEALCGMFTSCRFSSEESTAAKFLRTIDSPRLPRSEEHTSELQSLRHLVC